MLSLRKTFKIQHAQRIAGRDMCKIEYLKAADMAVTRCLIIALCLLVYHFGWDWNISTTIGWIGLGLGWGLGLGLGWGLGLGLKHLMDWLTQHFVQTFVVPRLYIPVIWDFCATTRLIFVVFSLMSRQLWNWLPYNLVIIHVPLRSNCNIFCWALNFQMHLSGLILSNTILHLQIYIEAILYFYNICVCMWAC